MPIGLVGLMIAAIFAAAMSASGGELNALATATIIDFYRRHFVKEATDAHYLLRVEAGDDSPGACSRASSRCTRRTRDRSSRWSTATARSSTARCSASSSSRILTKRATARGAFWGLIAGMAVVLTVAFQLPWIAFLWHNLIGAVVVVRRRDGDQLWSVPEPRIGKLAHTRTLATRFSIVKSHSYQSASVKLTSVRCGLCLAARPGREGISSGNGSAEAGYSLVEMMLRRWRSWAVLAGMAVFQIGPSRPALKGDGAMRVVLSQMNAARELGDHAAPQHAGDVLHRAQRCRSSAKKCPVRP